MEGYISHEEVDLTKSNESDPQSLLIAVESELEQVNTSIQHLFNLKVNLNSRRDTLLLRIAQANRPPAVDYSASFPWDAAVNHTLQTVFHLPSFRPLQRQVINAALHGRDILVLMPSGGGKSLLYQLPGLVHLQETPPSSSSSQQQQQQQQQGGGLTLVISPLLALIIDQVNQLRDINIPAASLTSLTSKEETSSVFKQLDAIITSGIGNNPSSSLLKLLYVTPERVIKSKRLLSKLEKLYQANKLRLIAVDESHCCSAWGHDFRPDYAKLGLLKESFPNCQIMALTATATSQVADNICSILKINNNNNNNVEVFKSSVNRPNLFYEVVPKPTSNDALVQDIATWIKVNYPNGESGIIYVLTRKDAETLAAELGGAEHGISCVAYHADMEGAVRTSIHEAWTRHNSTNSTNGTNGKPYTTTTNNNNTNSIQVIVATIAFGMGINKIDVRFVIHQTMSKSVENYYQESGRAGRDGLPAHCRLYYRFNDFLRHASVVVGDQNWQTCLQSMLQYAAAASASTSGSDDPSLPSSPSSQPNKHQYKCRRHAISVHFGEAVPACGNLCDLCRLQRVNNNNSSSSVSPSIDCTAAAERVVQVLQTWVGSEKRATLTQLIDKARTGIGKDNNNIAAAAKALSREDLEKVIEQLYLRHILFLEFGFTGYSTNTYLKVAAASSSVPVVKKLVISSVSQQQLVAMKHAVKPGIREVEEEEAEEKLTTKGKELFRKGQEEEEIIDLLDSESDDYVDVDVKIPSARKRRKSASS